MNLGKPSPITVKLKTNAERSCLAFHEIAMPRACPCLLLIPFHSFFLFFRLVLPILPSLPSLYPLHFPFPSSLYLLLFPSLSSFISYHSISTPCFSPLPLSPTIPFPSPSFRISYPSVPFPSFPFLSLSLETQVVCSCLPYLSESSLSISRSCNPVYQASPLISSPSFSPLLLYRLN